MKIRLTDWAKKHFSPPPPIRQLYRMANTGQIQPQPVKVGRSFYVDENATIEPIEPSPAPGLSPQAERILESV